MVQMLVFNEEGKNSGQVEASDAVFGRKMNQPVVQETLRWFLASRRAGTHGSKTRAEVRGGGKKPWQQKGTGRARAGSIRSPLWRKGGVVFGPKPRDYGYALPIKVRKAALMVVLSDKVKENAFKVVEAYKISSAKTKQAAAFLKGIGVSGKVLCIVGKKDEIFARSARNIDGVEIAAVNDLNVYNLLQADFVIAAKSEIPKIEEFADYAA
ncbi:MAG: 50S ribosomal protein L4 [Candidatus Margulisbacteria bacterium]|nr:50S ribosomal protein L4 [Candidatus Margulisiibacteriota bacterium]